MTSSVTGYELWQTTLAEREVSRRTTSGAGASATLSELLRRATLDVPGRGTLIIQYKDNEPAWLWHTLAGVKPLFALGPNWDSYGAAVIDPGVVVYALNFLPRILGSDTPTPSVVPTADGGIQFEWHSSGIDLEIAFGPSKQIEVAFLDIGSGDDEWFVEGQAVYDDLDDVRRAVARL